LVVDRLNVGIGEILLLLFLAAILVGLLLWFSILVSLFFFLAVYNGYPQTILQYLIVSSVFGASQRRKKKKHETCKFNTPGLNTKPDTFCPMICHQTLVGGSQSFQ
jgi:hypothetical protein